MSHLQTICYPYVLFQGRIADRAGIQLKILKAALGRCLGEHRHFRDHDETVQEWLGDLGNNCGQINSRLDHPFELTLGLDLNLLNVGSHLGLHFWLAELLNAMEGDYFLNGLQHQVCGLTLYGASEKGQGSLYAGATRGWFGVP